jgi:enoyl-CoA hydratase/carnithine racemase
MTAPAPNLLVDQHEDVLTLTLDTPAKANALAPDMVERMIDTLDTAQGVRLAILRGNGRHFCAGFDLSGLEDMSDGDLLWRFVRIEMLLQKVHKAPFPIVALAQGQVVGAGADLFAACWKRVATQDTRFRMPGWNFELALGTRRLAQLIGMDAARDMLIDTRAVAAPEAVSLGLATDIAEPADWPALIDRLAARARSLPDRATRDMLRLTSPDTDDLDLAAVVRTAGRPGLKDRILAYRRRMEAQSSEKRAAPPAG